MIKYKTRTFIELCPINMEDNMEDTIVIGNVLRILRVANDLSITEVKERCSISRSYLSEIENGKKQPSLEKILEVLNVYNVTIEEFKEIVIYYNKLNSDVEETKRYQLTLLKVLKMLIEK